MTLAEAMTISMLGLAALGRGLGWMDERAPRAAAALTAAIILGLTAAAVAAALVLAFGQLEWLP